MHTSTILRSEHFQYRCLDGGALAPADFDALWPEYHALDRLGIVSGPFESGLRHTGLAGLAWTTAFYDVMRATHPDGFFNYPQHYLFYMVDEGTAVENEVSGGAMKAWSHLDVWPDCKRVASPGSVTNLVERLFNFEINRVLWPCSLTASGEDGTLPEYVKHMLHTRLKDVYIYGSDSPTLEIRAAEPATRLTREAAEYAGLGAAPIEAAFETHERIGVGEFLNDYLGSAFEKA